MAKDQPIYDLLTLARHNLHVHTTYSSCAKPEMTMENIIRYAEVYDLNTIAITDHFNDRDYKVLKYNQILRRQVEKLNTKVKVLYGAELSAYGIGRYLDPIEVNQALDYRLYSYNHFHLEWWEQPEDKSPRGYVNHQIEVLAELIKSGRADCIAHPFIGRFIRCIDDRTAVTREITNSELGEIMKFGKDHGVAWEINSGAMLGDPDFAKRYWNMGREVGVKFNFGTDAHRLIELDIISAVREINLMLG